MYHLRLNKGLSYHGVVNATKKNPDVFTEDEAVMKAALDSGYFDVVDDRIPIILEKRVAEEPVIVEPVTEEEPEMVTDLSKMTVTELRQYASIIGVPLEDNMKKGAILKAIEKAGK